jgi:beta-N-acetylhexosaminidase
MHPSFDLTELNISIGRLFMAGMPGTQVDTVTESLIRDFCLGGIILFSRNIKGPVQVASLCRELQRLALKFHGIPLFIAVDQEGGRVARLKKPFTVFPGNKAIGEDDNSVARAVEFARVTSNEMSLVGINMNFAPVLDVCGEDCEKHLAGRTFGDDPEKVAFLGQTMINRFQAHGIMTVAKHFPGLGRSAMDPHYDLPSINITDREMDEINLLPFRSAIRQQVAGIMTSHAIYPFLEPEISATLSNKIISGILINKLGFKGLVISDDLEMGAIKKKWGVPAGAVASFEAGCDILLICSEQQSLFEAISLLRKKFLCGEIPFSRLNISLSKIRKAKDRFLNPMPEISIKAVRSRFKF